LKWGIIKRGGKRGTTSYTSGVCVNRVDKAWVTIYIKNKKWGKKEGAQAYVDYGGEILAGRRKLF